MTDVFVDNKFVGNVDDPETFVERIINERRVGKISDDVNVRYDELKEKVIIETAQGRVARPLIVVKDGESALTDKHIQQLEDDEIGWSDLVDQGIIEYLDATEEENALVAFSEEELTEDHTHLEVTALSILSLTTSLVPFGNYNQGVRLNQGAKNQKQAIGFYASNFHVRMDTDVNLLHYPQTPIVRSFMHDVSSYDEHPSGQNITMAVMTYKGYNMEDALVFNAGSVDRGMNRSTYFRPLTAEELRYSGGLMDEITIPDKEVKGYKSEEEYKYLGDDGIIYPEAKVDEGDVVIGRVSPPRFLSSMDDYSLSMDSRRESSFALQHGEKGTVDFVALTENDEGNKLVQVRLREQRIPEVGDKFTSRHGQKGVISMLVPEEDVPFTSRGMRPDIIFSPHGIPSRMTVSHLLEMLGGKVGSYAGRYVDGTMFDSEDENDLRDELKQLGFREDGSQTLYNGITGERYPVHIYVGNIYYLRLKHMVANKMHARARGPIQLLTRQPTEGRSKEGGLRLGEMEKDTFVAHGASLTLKERFDSDKVVVPVDEKSGLMGYYDARKNNRAVSSIHGEDAKVSDVEMSYAFKLLLDEFKALGIYPKLDLESKF